MMKFLLGIVGFAGFEALRIYKRLWAGLPILPIEKNKLLYVFSLIVLAIFSGLVAHFLAHGNVVETIFIGFSVPTGFKTFTAQPQPKTETVDDIETKKPTPIAIIYAHLREYFRF